MPTPRALGFPDLLAEQLRGSAGRPLVTFYDDLTGERVELSVTTYANWVAKTAGLLQDELDVGRGARVLLDLPPHWLGPVWLGALWSVGACAVTGPDHDLVVSGPARLERHAARGGPVVGLSLLPLGARFADPLPDGVVDYGAVVWGQPDAFHPYDAPTAGDPAWEDHDSSVDQQALVEEARSGPYGAPGTRLLTDVNPCTRAGTATLLGPLAAGGGTVWVRHAAAGSWERRAASEQATATVVEGARGA